MRFLVPILLAAPVICMAQQSVYVPGRVDSNGQYQQGYYRTAPNNTTLDNYSTRGNVNPYTGQAGTRDPYPAIKPYTAPTYTPSPVYQAPKPFFQQKPQRNQY